jgi:hypothetical protein
VINHDGQNPRRRSSRAVPALIAILFAAATVMAGGRVVAVGDVHGTVDGLTGILRAADLIDESNVWIGGDATLVQTGDLLDRGIQRDFREPGIGERPAQQRQPGGQIE